MSNSIGSSLIFTLFGESHSEYIGGTLDGLPGGLFVDEEFMKKMLLKRRPKSDIDTPRIEEDDYQIISGVFNGYTTGAPLTILIKNQNVDSRNYDKNLIRPNHADYAAKIKYHGYEDYRGGGHFSGRLTAVIVALGSILLKALENKGIRIKSHILSIGEIKDNLFSNFEKEFDEIDKKEIPLISDKEDEIKALLKTLKEEKDSVGGQIETAIINLPSGVGEPWFSSLEGVLSNAMFSIGGVKGIEFGKGFSLSQMRGSSANDELFFNGDKIETKTNNCGGIYGGISIGTPIVFTLAIKPTPSIGQKQNSIDLENKKNVEIEIKGRHDPAIVRRISPVVECLTAIVLSDELVKLFGRDYLL